MSSSNETLEMEIGDVVDVQPSVHLYSIEMNLQTREFKGQTSGVTKCSVTIYCDTVPEFKNHLWAITKDKFKREVVFDADNDPRWHENILPQEEDMGRFVLFYDSKSKRSLTLDKINMTTISHWRSKEIWLYIHVYSMSIANLSLWKKVQKILIEPVNRDRAGASTIAEMNTLVARLKEIHRLSYQSNHINWLMWANRIQASESHLRENLMSKPPPPDMLHLFALARTSADDTVTEVRQNLHLAENVNDGVSSGLFRVRNLMDDIMKIQHAISDLRDEEKTKIELLNYELKTMETQAVTTRSMITSMEQVLPATETDFGRQLFSEIQDQDDVDHA